MRHPENGTNSKCNTNRPIHKRRRRSERRAHYRSKRRRSVAMENLECINEALRHHKGFGQGSWKLVPKDSCEVYKDQRKRDDCYKRPDTGKRPPARVTKRPDKNIRNISPSTSGDTSISDEDSRYSREENARVPKKLDKSKKQAKNTKKSPKKPHSDTTVSSCTTHSYSENSLSTATRSTSRASTDMDE